MIHQNYFMKGMQNRLMSNAKKYFLFLGLSLTLVACEDTETPASPPDLQLRNTRTIYCRDIYGVAYPFMVNSLFVYRLNAYDIYGNWAVFDIWFDYFGNPIEACSGYPIFPNFLNPYAQGVGLQLSSMKTVINQPDGSNPTQSAPSSPLSTFIQVVGTSDPDAPPVVIGPPLGPGQTYEVNTPISVTTGTTYEDVVVIDPDSTVQERNEANNNNNGIVNIGRVAESNRYAQKLRFRVPALEEIRSLETPFYLLDFATQKMELFQNGDDFVAKKIK